MRSTKLACLALATFLALMIGGCGSSRDSAGIQGPESGGYGTDPATGYSRVGSATCIGCHQDFSWSKDIVSAYYDGKHVIHSNHINQLSEDVCLSCHDPIGDGPALQQLPTLAAKLDALTKEEGLAAVGCENCHGAGGEHFGVGPIPAPRPNPDKCGQCHDDQWESIPEAAGHLNYHPEGNRIYSDWVSSPHNNIHDGSPCVKCHTDEGARKYKDYDTFESLVTAVEIPNPSPIQCRTCHDPHNVGNALLEGEKTEGHGASEHVVESAEYATCTNCHQRHDAQLGSSVQTLPGSTSSDGASGDLIYHAARYTRVISSTHYDNPATSYESSQLDPSDPNYAPNIVEGYTMDPTNERTCRNCHNVHSADITINDEWARSGHGGELLEAKEAVNADSHSFAGAVAYRAAGSGPDNAFVHYDWDAENRQSCQMCHSTTGFVNYVADPANYDPANNDFSQLVGWSKDPETGVVTSSGQNELLYCWGCHKNNAGGLRVSGAVTATYTYNDQPIVFPDVGSSNTCVVCHSGRGNNDPVSTSSRFAGHHAPAAADLFAEQSHVAYEYPGLSYAPQPYFAHPDIDVNGSGPCVACHMDPDGVAGNSPDHTFAVVEKNAAGEITSINAEVCVSCHDGEHALFVSSKQVGETVNIWNGTAAVPTVVTQEMADQAAATLEEEAVGYQDAGQLVNDLLNNANGLVNYTGAKITNSNTVDNDLGAFQNAKLPSDEPGGFAHNRYYVKRAIFDAIDWVEDGAIDGTIKDYTAQGYAEAINWLGTTRP